MEDRLEYGAGVVLCPAKWFRTPLLIAFFHPGHACRVSKSWLPCGPCFCGLSPALSLVTSSRVKKHWWRW